MLPTGPALLHLVLPQDVYILVRQLRNRFLTASSTARVIMGNRGRPIRHTTKANRLHHTVYGARDPIEDCCLDVRMVMLGCSGLAKMCKTETGEMLFSLMNQDSMSLMPMVDTECLGDVTNVILIPVLWNTNDMEGEALLYCCFTSTVNI